MHEQQVRRPGEHETSRPPAPIDRPLDGEQQFGRPLHLVQGHRPVSAHERIRVAAGRVDHVQVVQRAVAPAGRRERLNQGALAGLAGARDHRRHDPQAVAKTGGNEAGECEIIHAVNEIRSSLGRANASPRIGRNARGARRG